MSTVLLSVGDASGDMYAGDFVRALRAHRPDVRCVGMGGVEMEKAGVEIVVDQRELAVGGLVELLPELPRIARAWCRMRRALRSERPDLVVLVDSSGFNLPFARSARRRGIPSLYYVAPQVWSWRRGRIQKLERRVDRLAVILPFECEVYAGTGLDVDYVGHPLAERLAEHRVGRQEARRRLGLDPGARVVALLPGSRRSELHHNLPLHLEVARALHARDSHIHFVVAAAPSLTISSVADRVRAAGLPSQLAVEVVHGRAHELLCGADVAIAKPGTSTLEAALLGCSLVVAARTGRLTAAMLRRMLAVDSLTLPNLIAGAPIVPEFLQQDAVPGQVALAVLELLDPDAPGRARQRAALAAVCERLGGGGAARRAAGIAEEMLRGRLAS